MERKCDEKQVESLAIELTRDCNNNCLFCYQRKGGKTKVDVERLKRKIVEYRKMGVRYIEFSGGEPTLSSHLPGLIKLAKKEKYENISLLTNGRRLAYKKYFDSLIEAGLKTIIFSIPGHTAELYKKITQTDKESFYQLADALDTADRERKKIEILIAAILQPKYLILDEIDTGLDVDALKIIAGTINDFKKNGSGIIIITHYSRILKYAIPDKVHVLIKGQIVKTGDKNLADKIERKGYKKLTEEKS